VVPHNLVHKYKHALVNKDFKFFINLKKKPTHKHIYETKKGEKKKLKEIEKNIEKKQ